MFLDTFPTSSQGSHLGCCEASRYFQVGSGGNSFYFHGTDLLEGKAGVVVHHPCILFNYLKILLPFPAPQGREEEGVYLYPGLAKAVVGVWRRPAREERYDTQGYK